MEALADPTSTNLYMEGLPLSMDDAVCLHPSLSREGTLANAIVLGSVRPRLSTSRY